MPATPDDRVGQMPTTMNGHLVGPWDQGFYFVLRDRPQSKSNYRTGGPTQGRTWSSLKAFATQVTLAARAARPRGWDPGNRDQAVAARPRIVAYIYARTLLDAGNISKSILDAVEAPRAPAGRPAASRDLLPPTAIMVTDAQVAAVHDMVERTSTNPGALIAFVRLPPGANLAAVAAASLALQTQCAALLGAGDPTAPPAPARTIGDAHPPTEETHP